MTQEATKRFIDALKTGAKLKDEFIYYMSFSDYQMFPDPFLRTKFTVREVQESIRRYANPQNPSELFQWDIHGRLFTPAEISLPNTAVVMIHGGAANEYEFIFTPDGPEDYPDLTQTDPTKARVGVAQHIASLGVQVLAISLPGHYRRKPWPSVAERRPEFVIGEVPNDEELKNRLAVYTFRMCVEAIKTLVEKTLDESIFMWGHSTGGEYFYLMEQFGLKNPHQVPTLSKIVLNVGAGEAIKQPKFLDSIVEELATITGQQPVRRKAKKSIANYGLREGQEIGASVTLRGARMWEFLDRFVTVAIPRIRDFRGVNTRSFDGRGNYTLGVKEQMIFPEINYDMVEQIHGMDITFVTTTNRDDMALALLRELGMPFRGDDKPVIVQA